MRSGARGLQSALDHQRAAEAGAKAEAVAKVVVDGQATDSKTKVMNGEHGSIAAGQATVFLANSSAAGAAQQTQQELRTSSGAAAVAAGNATKVLDDDSSTAPAMAGGSDSESEMNKKQSR